MRNYGERDIDAELGRTAFMIVTEWKQHRKEQHFPVGETVFLRSIRNGKISVFAEKSR